jgi:hypothetical protein
VNQVLAAVISQQEHLQTILQQHIAWIEQLTGQHDSHAAAVDQVTAEECLPSTAAVHVVASCSQLPALPSDAGYTLRLLATATREEVLQAALMTPAQLRDWYVDAFKSLTPLLELSRRSVSLSGSCAADAAELCNAAGGNAIMDVEAAIGAGDVQRSCSRSTGWDSSRPATDAAAEAAAAAPLGSAADILPVPQPTAAIEAATAAAAATAVASDSQSDEYAAGIDPVVQAALAELEGSMVNVCRMGALTLLHNPVAIHLVAATNLATGQPAAAPPHHWLRVRWCMCSETCQLQQLAGMLFSLQESCLTLQECC